MTSSIGRHRTHPRNAARDRGDSHQRMCIHHRAVPRRQNSKQRCPRRVPSRRDSCGFRPGFQRLSVRCPRKQTLRLAAAQQSRHVIRSRKHPKGGPSTGLFLAGSVQGLGPGWTRVQPPMRISQRAEARTADPRLPIALTQRLRIPQFPISPCACAGAAWPLSRPHKAEEPM